MRLITKRLSHDSSHLSVMDLLPKDIKPRLNNVANRPDARTGSPVITVDEIKNKISTKLTVDSPFLHVSNYDSLRVALKGNKLWSNTYNDIFNVSNKANGQYQKPLERFRTVNNQLSKAKEAKFKPIVDSNEGDYSLKLPQDIEMDQLFLMFTESNNVMELIDNLMAHHHAFSRYSFTDICYLLIYSCEGKDVQHLDQFSQIFHEKILQFNLQTINLIIKSLLKCPGSESLALINVINDSYVSQRDSDLFLQLSPSVIKSYIMACVQNDDLQHAKPLLDSLLKSKWDLTEEVTTPYIYKSYKLVQNLPIEMDKKFMLFNNLTLSLRNVIIRDGFLTPDVIKAIVRLHKLSQLPLVINYFQLNPSYASVKPFVLEHVLSKLDKTATADAKLVTAMLTKVGYSHSDEDIPVELRQKIAQLYSKLGSLLACRLWSF